MQKLKCYGLDLDGVNFEFIVGFRTWLEKKYGVVFDRNTPVETFWHTQSMSISEKDFMDAFHEFGQSGGYRHAPLIDGALEVAKDLDSLGHKIIYITNRPQYAIEDTQYALEINLFPQNKNLNFTDGKKSPIINSLGVDIFVDDAPHVIEDICLNTKAKIYCMDYFYNRKLCNSLNFIRITDWKHFREMENL
jgi:uncharacterized HAD superfamily protein